ncbi:hypothetical protein ACQBAR_08880 [Propionibacteriaceae bacterium Y1685]|uniref:hypothetical protein n=1 Tax=Microlunatus sp. Y1700 TaxID=3418487 RepID=UPI003B7B0CA1
MPESRYGITVPDSSTKAERCVTEAMAVVDSLLAEMQTGASAVELAAESNESFAFTEFTRRFAGVAGADYGSLLMDCIIYANQLAMIHEGIGQLQEDLRTYAQQLIVVGDHLQSNAQLESTIVDDLMDRLVTKMNEADKTTAERIGRIVRGFSAKATLSEGQRAASQTEGGVVSDEDPYRSTGRTWDDAPVREAPDEVAAERAKSAVSQAQ